MTRSILGAERDPLAMRRSAAKPAWGAYAVAVVAVGFATLCRFALDPLLGSGVPFLMYFPAVVLMAWWAGFGPAALASVLSLLAADYFFVEPRHELMPNSLVNWISLGLFLFVSLSIAWMSELLHRARRRAETHVDQVRERDALVTGLLEGNLLGVAITRFDGGIVYANDYYLRMIGCSRAELESGALRWDQITPPQWRDVETRALEELKQRGYCTPFEKEYVRKDGSCVPVLLASVRAPAQQGGEIFTFCLDLTPIRAATTQLKASEGKFRSLAEALPQFVLSINPAGAIDYVNAYWVQYTGIPLEQCANGGWLKALDPDDRARAQAAVEESLKDGQPSEMQFRFRRAHDGAYRWHIGRLTPVRDHATGQITQWFANALDIDDQRQAAQATADVAERLRVIVTQSIAAIVQTDITGRFVFCNQRFCQMLGRSMNEVLKLSMQDVTHPDDLGQSMANLRGTFAGRGGFVMEKRYVRPDGQVIWAQTSVGPVADAAGEVRGVVAVLQDITDRKRAEAAARESEQRFRVTADQAPVLIWMSDATRKLIWFNRPWLEFTGRSMEQEVDDGWTQGVHPEDLQRCSSIYSGSFEARREFKIEYRLRRHDGQYRWMLDNGVPRFDAAGNFVGFIGSCIDITDRRRADEEREALLSSERAARGEAERTARMKDEFLATLSHELRTPMNAILGWAQLLRMGAVTGAEAEQGLETIERNARAQAQLIEDLLDTSRIISGKLRLDVKVVDLAEVIDGAIETVRTAADAKEIKLNRSVDPAAGPVVGDAGRLQQVIWNLLSNAIKFTPRGGRVHVLVTGAQTEGHVDIAVSDTGQGIASEFLLYVFERFRQFDSSTTRKFGGLGLGLAIVRHLVELHGGTVDATSAGDGRGATFTVHLPIAPAPATTTVAAPSRATQRSGTDSARQAAGSAGDETLAALPLAGGPPLLVGVRVLLVEDDADARDLLRRLLEASDAEVVAAGSVGEAMSRLSEPQARFDVLVSDISMPGEDGFTLLSRVRQLPPEQGGTIPAIAVTAFARQEDQQRSLRAGFQAHLAKPVEPASLVNTIARLSRRSPAEAGVSSRA
jgi:PAS domain S-box-containing protein